MQIYINQNEIKAIRDAWEEVNEKLEACFDDNHSDDYKTILKHLGRIEKKYKSKQRNNF